MWNHQLAQSSETSDSGVETSDSIGVNDGTLRYHNEHFT